MERSRSASERVSREKQELQDSNNLEQEVLTAQKGLQEIASKVQHKVHKQLVRIVSRCLSTVFGRRCELRVFFEKKRGKTEARFMFLEDGKKVGPNSTSGALREVTGLALRVTKIILSRPPVRRLLILDEPFLALTKENKERMAALLKSLSKELDLQIILCTHDQALQVGTVIDLGGVE